MIYFVRHGKTDWNGEGRIQGRCDIPLNAEGKMQAAELGEKLSDVHFDVAFSSPLSRAEDTCKAVYDGKIITDDRLIERNFGTFEGKPFSSEEFNGFWSITNELKIDGLESVAEVERRLTDFVDFVRSRFKGQNVLAATHGGVMMVLKHVYVSPVKDNLLENLPKNAEIIAIEN